MIWHCARAGCALAEASLGVEIYNRDAILRSPTQLAGLPRAGFLSALQVQPKAALSMIETPAREIQTQRHVYKCCAFAMYLTGLMHGSTFTENQKGAKGSRLPTRSAFRHPRYIANRREGGAKSFRSWQTRNTFGQPGADVEPLGNTHCT
ncbi:MAG: hypothetical protein AAFQ19_15955 [Pseudomonadota bacterium]